MDKQKDSASIAVLLKKVDNFCWWMDYYCGSIIYLKYCANECGNIDQTYTAQGLSHWKQIRQRSHSLEVRDLKYHPDLHLLCEIWTVGICFASYVILYQVPLGDSAGWIASLVDIWTHGRLEKHKSSFLLKKNNSNQELTSEQCYNYLHHEQSVAQNKVTSSHAKHSYSC